MTVETPTQQPNSHTSLQAVLHRAVGAGGSGGSCPSPPDFGRSVNPTGGGGILFVPHYYLSLRIFRPTYGPATRVAHKPNHMDDYIFKAQQQSMVNCLLSRLVYIQSLALHAFSLSMQGLAFCWMQASHRACSDSYDFGRHSRLWNTPVIFLLRSSFSVFWKLKNKFSSHLIMFAMQNGFKKVLNEHNFNATMTVHMSHKYLVKMSGAWKYDFNPLCNW